MMELKQKLLEKSKEAFMMAIEIYNKPSIRYRVEGFSFFICNAWELMLKAHMLNKFGDASIYFKDNPSRTLSLESCIQKVFTNDKDPLRKNLMKIIELRNTSTHFITEEYDMVFVPLFQATVFNFIEKMQEFHEIDMAELFPYNFLSLAVSYFSFDADAVRAKYPPQIAEKLIGLSSELSGMIADSNNRFAVQINHMFYITKDESKATAKVRIDNTSETGVRIVNKLKDPNTTHKFRCKACCEEINKRLKKLGIQMLVNGEPKAMNAHYFGLFCEYYGIKENQKFCYVYTLTAQPQYSYSIQTIDFIVEEIKKDPDNIIRNLQNSLKRKKES